MPQPYHDRTFMPEIYVLYALGAFIILLRMAVRIRTVGFRGWQGDDYMAIIALICYTMDTVCVFYVFYYGTNVDFTPAQLAAMSEADQKKVVIGSKMELVAWYNYCTLVWSLKATMLFFFYRLTVGLRQQRLVKVFAVIFAVTYVAVFLTITFGCHPFKRNWQLDPNPGLTCTFKPQNFYVMSVLNVLTDAALLAIPVPLLWALQVSLRKKIILGLLLSSGVFVVSAAIIRAVMTLGAHPSALTVNRWGVRETLAGVIAVNLPILRSLFNKDFWTGPPPKSAKVQTYDSRSALTNSTASTHSPGFSSSRGRDDDCELALYHSNSRSLVTPSSGLSDNKSPHQYTTPPASEHTFSKQTSGYSSINSLAGLQNTVSTSWSVQRDAQPHQSLSPHPELRGEDSNDSWDPARRPDLPGPQQQQGYEPEWPRKEHGNRVTISGGVDEQRDGDDGKSGRCYPSL